MPRGGARQGRQGAAYPQRTDLNAQPIRTAPSQSYGDGVAQADAQRAIPLPQQPPPEVTSLAAPSGRPGEPLTAGMAMGPGPGPGALIPAVDPVVETLRAAAEMFPNPGIFALLEALDSRR